MTHPRKKAVRAKLADSSGTVLKFRFLTALSLFVYQSYLQSSEIHILWEN
jgi:hypothetical protein